VELHGCLAQAYIGSDLLVEAAGNRTCHHLALASRQGLQTAPQIANDLFPVATGAILLDSPMERIQKLLGADGLGQKLHRWLEPTSERRHNLSRR
jgi:hypothetical protein